MEEPSISKNYPAKLDFLGKTAQDSSWIHLIVSAEGMEHIYLSVKKIDAQVDEPVNKYAVDGRAIAFEVISLTQGNGKYQMTLVGSSATG